MTGQKYEGTISFEILVIIEPDESRFHAYTPALKGIHVDGGTVEEALDHAQDAIISYLESLFTHGDPIPIGPGLKIEEQSSKPPAGAITELITIQWPIPNMSGINSRT